ncbi:hypothetical protein KSP40_PGU003130 [Platanthera guangdongensis]
MVLLDWQRGWIPFFMPPPQAPQQEDESHGSTNTEELTISTDRNSAAFRAIAGIITSQQQMHLPGPKYFPDCATECTDNDDSGGAQESENANLLSPAHTNDNVGVGFQ